jgi:uncharacterized Zn finger protein
MPVRPCPNCTQLSVRELESLSKDAYAFYYRCQGCGHIWTVPKADPHAAPFTVVQGREMVSTE